MLSKALAPEKWLREQGNIIGLSSRGMWRKSPAQEFCVTTLPSMMWWSTEFSGDKLEQKSFCHMTVGKTAQEHKTVKCTYVLILLDTVKMASYPLLPMSEKRVKTFIHSEGLHAVFRSSCSTKHQGHCHVCTSGPTVQACHRSPMYRDAAKSMHEHFPLPNMGLPLSGAGKWDCSLSLMCYPGRWGSGLQTCFIMKTFGKWISDCRLTELLLGLLTLAADRSW